MKYCKACKVSVDNPVERCPLCYSILSPVDNQPELPSYPDLLEQSEKYHLIYRILLMLSVTVCSICITINVLTFERYWWSLVVVTNIAYLWAAVGTAVRRRAKPGFNIMIQAISLAALCIALDSLTGWVGWSLNYVAPFLFISATLSITILVIVQYMHIHSFILYFILIALLGFIPIILMAFQLVTVLWPSLVSALYSALSLVSIFIFANSATKLELKKRFHL